MSSKLGYIIPYDNKDENEKDIFIIDIEKYKDTLIYDMLNNNEENKLYLNNELCTRYFIDIYIQLKSLTEYFYTQNNIIVTFVDTYFNTNKIYTLCKLLEITMYLKDEECNEYLITIFTYYLCYYDPNISIKQGFESVIEKYNKEAIELGYDKDIKKFGKEIFVNIKDYKKNEYKNGEYIWERLENGLAFNVMITNYKDYKSTYNVLDPKNNIFKYDSGDESEDEEMIKLIRETKEKNKKDAKQRKKTKETLNKKDKQEEHDDGEHDDGEHDDGEEDN